MSSFTQRIRTLVTSWLTNLVSISDNHEDIFSNVDWFEDDHKLLGDYSVQDIESILEKFEILSQLREIGFKDLIVTVNDSDPFVHFVIVTDKSIQHLPPYSNFLISLYIRRKNFAVADFKTLRREGMEDQTLIGCNPTIHEGMKKALPHEIKLSVLEWVCMQNPTKEFTKERPALPGQRHPGLRVARKFLSMLTVLAEKKKRDGLMNIPEYYHNAYLYAQKGMLFINPIYNAYFESINSDLEKDIQIHGLSEVSAAFALGLVINTTTQEKIKWYPQEQIYPTSDLLKKYFADSFYKNNVRDNMYTKGTFKILWEDFEKGKHEALFDTSRPPMDDH